MSNVEELQQWYDEGIITRGELIAKIIDLAATTSPALLIAALPVEIVDELRQRAESTPASSEEGLYISGALYDPSINVEAALRERNEEAFNGIWALHRYFFPC
jgi:hypothetical protein